MENILWYSGHELLIPDIVKAENCYLYDSAGKRYIDFESGVWCTSIGHCNPRINSVIKEQIGKISHTGYCYTSKLVEEAASEILDVIGFKDGKCVFLCSGSEAVEYGVRAAQNISGKPLMLTFTDSYFGAYGSAAQKLESEWYLFDWLNNENVSQIPFEKIGGFLFEPGSSSGFVRFPPIELIQNIVNRIRDKNGLIIINEVTTGIGRTGKWFGHNHYNFQPDIVAMGKGLGNGYPVSATAFNKKVGDIVELNPIKYAQSHQNDPLGASVAREVVRIIKEEKLIERSKRLGEYFINELKNLARNYDTVKEIRGRGLMIAVEFNRNGESFAAFVRLELLERGFIVAQRPGSNVLRIDPSLTVEESDIKEFLVTFKSIVSEVQNKKQ
jgi:acetylornithine aminotransferase